MDDPMDKTQNIMMADLNPKRLLVGEKLKLIDEWQIAPKLWDAIRFEVDHEKDLGQFILTGSAVPRDTKEVTHSGVGRFSWITMRTMSLYESNESTGEVSLEDLFNGKKEVDGESKLKLEVIVYLICRGGWPLATSMKEDIALDQAFDYIDAVIRSDINRADGVIKNPEKVRRFMKAYARLQGSQASIFKIKEDLSNNSEGDISKDTILQYINALKKIFVIEDMEAWNPNLRSKTAIRTSPTRYFIDPSIASSSLGLGPEDLFNDLNTFGLLFETLCVRDLRVYSESLNGEVYHYRDKDKLECDTVIHLRNGKYALIEIKLGGEKLIEEACVNLKKLENKIDIDKMNKPSFMMVLVGNGNYPYRRNDRIFVVPIGC